MLRTTPGKLYSLTGAALVIAVVHLGNLPLGPFRLASASSRTIELVGLDAPGAPVPSAWAASSCRGCDVCGQGKNEHMLYSDGARVVMPGQTDHVGECYASGPCDAWHPVDPAQCGRAVADAAPDLTNLWQGLANGMPAYQVATAVRKWPKVIELNSARQAIQVVGCEGQIIAHLPISSDDVKTLQALLE